MKNPDTIEHRLRRLTALRRQKADILREEATLATPMLADYSLLPGIYDHFCRIISGLPESKQPDARARKKLFLFIALYLYCPQALAGEKIEWGLRSRVAKAMNIPNNYGLSYHCKGLDTWYMQYPDFHRAVDYILHRILKHIQLI